MALQRIRDALHNLIEFRTDQELERNLWRILQSRPFQRLRRIKQLGFSELVYPGASHSRFAHSVGVFHTARRLIEVIRRKEGESSRERFALAAALVHDLGHGPFSHAFESVGKRLGLQLADHERVSDLLIRDGEIAELLNDEMGSGFAVDVADVVKGEGNVTVHNAVVSSQFDADRLDYMRRDRLMTGSEHSAIDFTWLMANLQIGELRTGVDEEETSPVKTFVIGPKAIYAAEAYVLGLFQLYPTVYFHKATRGAEKLFVELMVRVFELANDQSVCQTGLPDNHPIIRFAQNPDDLETVLRLDDAVIWGSLSLMADAKDRLVSEFSQRLRDRKLFKCIDVRTRVEHEFDPESTGRADQIDKIDACCGMISEKLTTWIDANWRDVPHVLIDEEKRSPYKDDAGLLGRINVLTGGGELVDLKQRSRVVASLRDYRFLRAYHEQSDNVASSAIYDIINGEVEACR